MENNLYYTPTIEEFHVGFECEIKNSSHPVNFEWEHFKIVGVDDAQISGSLMDWSFYDSYNAIKNSEIRVKYLDQSDIESLGWKSAGGYLNIKNFELSTGNAEKNTKENQWKLQLKEDNKIIIEQYRWMRFFGTIKNKSELIKLMQQLNIK